MIGCIIQARVNSTRLPKKVLKNIDDKKKVLEFIINQVKYSKKIDKIVIATTTKNDDDIITMISKKNNCDYFRGSEKDVLDRYYYCAKKFNFNSIVRITSDCPLIDPQIIDNVMPDDEFQEFYKHMMSDNFPWYHSDTVAYGELKGKTFYDWLPEHVKLELTDTQRDLLSGPITKDQQEYNYTFFHRLFENFYITSNH
mgnify:CR=1 FL=1